ncbi:MAG: UDP-N-acetylmuramate dehydrogenase, partial [Lachnospiraceae bacterium]|nr:UDP-N-acetylmuramate dehydrogenase [Lachnospiraceae bacterium]
IVDVFVIPEDIKELVKLIAFLRKEGIIYYILGRGSNILVSDKGLPGCVVYIGKDFGGIKIKGNKLECGAGATLGEVCEEALTFGLTGLEPLCGIPGSIGGAVAMNAGAYNREISDLVVSCDVIDETGKVKTLKKDKLDFSYRHSAIGDNDYIVTKVVLSLEEGDSKKIKEEMEKVKKWRVTRQPLEYPSAGSTFKRPETGTASELIDKCMLKGKTVGGAQVSDKHCGFIVNKDSATSNDVYKLMQQVKQQVSIYYGVDLEPEIKLWGKF